MSDEIPFRCPVCRASQTLGDACRRCKADLRLVARAHRRWAYLKRLRSESLSAGDVEQLRRIADELRWLAPTR